MKIGTIVTGVGVVTTITLQYIPQFIHWVQAVVPTSIKINVTGDGTTVDLDANGINSLNLIRTLGAVTNGYTLALSNGLITGKTVDIIITNGVAANIDLYGYSLQAKGNLYLQQIRNTILAASGTVFDKFAYLSLPSLAVADLVQVEFNDGLNQQFTQPELKSILQYTQNVVNGATNLAFDNFTSIIKKVYVTPVAQQSAYVARYVQKGNVSAVV